MRWSVPRAGRGPLTFQIHLPAEFELVDVPGLAAAAGAPATVEQAAGAMRQGAGPGGLVVIGALRPVDVPADRRPVVATLTVAFSEQVQGPPPGRPPGRDKVKRTSSTTMESLGEGMAPVPIEVRQYELETAYGALIIAFSTANQKTLGPRLHKLYERIFESVYLGEEPPE